MSGAGLTAAILIVSDSAASGTSEDRSSNELVQTLTSVPSATWEVVSVVVVRDEATSIRAHVREWAAKGINLILTSGGTGFAVRDVTPEAIEPILEKQAAGLVHAMLTSSLEKTPFAMMSRPVAGVCGGSVIVTLPGSPKGAQENLQAIIRLLPHACMQAAGGDSRALHKGGVEKLERDAGVHQKNHQSHTHRHGDHTHSHSHNHVVPVPHTRPEERPARSNDPTAGPGRRYRQSPYPMIDVKAAINMILEHCPKPSTTSLPLATNACGHVLAKDITAAEPVPHFRASIVDGYAIIIAEGKAFKKGIFKVASVAHAGSSRAISIEEGHVARITTGAPMPINASAVVMVEDTILISTTSDGADELEIEILTDEIKPGENIREIGSDVAAGSVILRAGSYLSHTGGELGLLASVGCKTIDVFRRPVVGVMSTGDEIVDIEGPATLAVGQVRDCNRIVILSALQGWGHEVCDLGIAPDNAQELESQIRSAYTKCDVIVTTGGASMGEHDLLKPVVERGLGGTVHFARVSMKPGKPTTFATIEVKEPRTGERVKKFLFSLPGNPASALVATAVFALPGLRRMSGYPVLGLIDPAQAWKRSGLPRVKAELAKPVHCDKEREEYVRVSVSTSLDGRLLAETTGGQRSSRIGSVAGANGLAVLPSGGGELKQGHKVEVLLMSDVV